MSVGVISVMFSINKICSIKVLKALKKFFFLIENTVLNHCEDIDSRNTILKTFYFPTWLI